MLFKSQEARTPGVFPLPRHGTVVYYYQISYGHKNSRLLTCDFLSPLDFERCKDKEKLWNCKIFVGEIYKNCYNRQEEKKIPAFIRVGIVCFYMLSMLLYIRIYALFICPLCSTFFTLTFSDSLPGK